MKVEFGIMAENIVQDAFDTAGFGKWQPLAPGTLELKETKTILVETTQLRKSIISKVVKK